MRGALRQWLQFLCGGHQGQGLAPSAGLARLGLWTVDCGLHGEAVCPASRTAKRRPTNPM